jgi:hypothetical protein
MPHTTRPTSSRFDRFRDSPSNSPKRSTSPRSSAAAILPDSSPVKAEIVGLVASRSNALTLVNNFNPSWADPFELIAQARSLLLFSSSSSIVSRFLLTQRQAASSLHLASSTAALKLSPSPASSETAARAAREALFSMGLKHDASHPHLPLTSSYGHLDAHGLHPAAVLRSISAHLAAGADLLEMGAWIVDPKGGLMCSTAVQFPQQQLAQDEQHSTRENSIIWCETVATMASRAARAAEMQAKPPSSSSRHPHYFHLIAQQLILSLDSASGSPLSHDEWSLLNYQTSNRPSKYGAIIFVPCLLGLLPPTTATVFHHGAANDLRATRVQILSSPSSSSSSSSSSFASSSPSGVGPVPIDLSPPLTENFYTARAVVAVAAKQVPNSCIRYSIPNLLSDTAYFRAQ